MAEEIPTEPERFVNLRGDTSEVAVNLSAAQMEALTRASRGVPGVHVLLENIPEQDLQPGPAHLGTFELVPNSEAWNISRFVGQHYGLRVSSVQKKGPGSFDETGKRTPKNHSLVVFV